MFKRIEIRLTGPICDCEEENLSWAPSSTVGLIIKCKTCQTILNIPHEKFVGRFIFDKSYPGKQVPNQRIKDVKFKLVDNGDNNG